MERLLEYFTPENYQLELRINKQTEEVQGHVIITGVSKSQKLKLHSRELKIIKVLVNQQPVKFQLDQKNQQLILDYSQKNTHLKIDIRYSFKLNHSMIGVYLSTYQYRGREERIVSTQFESHYARMAFPCIDEPAAKATFDLKIIDTDIEDTILGNMPIKTERILTYNSVNSDLDPKKDTDALNLNTNVSRKIVTFKTTPKMSTYLLAFCIGKFHKISKRNQQGVVVSTYAALNQSQESLEFSNQIAVEALDFYSQLFGCPYPLPKLDQVAIPDFDAGAMENWGLVTYRESCLLADQNTSKSTKEYIATVVTHELSHQWFGNLVTMEWWDNLWLNESFANMMQFYAVDHLRPDWRIWQDYFSEDCFYALRRDSLKNIQAVQQSVSDPAEIDSLFDGAIVYAKGSHLIFMLMRLMGERDFFAGLKKYFAKFQYQNTLGDDLWYCLQEYANFNVKELMDAWILQPGFPIIEGVSQRRFLSDGSTDQTSWPLPHVSDDMSGHYILRLSDAEFYQKLANFQQLEFEQKLRLLIDYELQMRTPLVKTSSVLDLLPKFTTETSESVWQIIASIICALKIFCPPTSPSYQKFQQYVISLITTSLHRLGMQEKEQENFDDLKLRPLILELAIYAEDQTVIQQLADEYDQKIGRKMNLSAASPERLGSILDAKFRFNNEQDFNQLLDKFRQESNPNYKNILLSTLTEARQLDNVQALLSFLEDQQTVRLQDHLSFFAQLLSNFWVKQQALGWFYSHWDYIKQVTSGKSIDDYVRVVAGRVTSKEEADRFFAFFDSQSSDPAISRALKIAKNSINTTLKWLKQDQASFVEKLDSILDTSKIKH